MTYNYMPQGSIFEDIDGQLYCEVDLLKGIKRPLNRAEIISNYQPKSCLIENKDGEIFNLIDLLLSVGQNSGGGSITQPTVDLQEVIDARTNLWGEEFKTLKQRLDADYVELARDLEIIRYYPYSGTGELSEIKHTTNGIIRGLYIEGNTINENGVRKSVGEESNKINILSKNRDGSKTSTKEILLPFNGGLKSLNGVCDVIEERENGIYVIQRISEDYQVLTTPIEYEIEEHSLNMDTYQDVTYVECENDIKPTVSFVADGEVYKGQDIKVEPSEVGYVKNMVIKGHTYQNLFNSPTEVISGTYDSVNQEFVNDQDEWVKIVKTDILKPNTTYTLLFLYKSTVDKINIRIDNDTVVANDTTVIKDFGDISATNNFQQFKETFTTFEKVTTSRLLIRKCYGGTVTIKCPVLLEGDWTNKEAPSITGIESVGDKENNKISILSHNKNLIDVKAMMGLEDNIMTDINSVHWSWNFASTWGSLFNRGGYTQLKPNTLYGIKCDLVIHDNKGEGGFYIRGSNNTVLSCSEKGSSCWFVTPSDGLVCLGIRGTWDNATEIDIEFNNITLVEFNTIPVTKEEKQALADSIILEKPKLDKKEILLPMQGGLKSLPNGTCDIIEQREDGVYLVQRVEKVAYTEGDENLDNCITDKTISYKAKATPKEIKLFGDLKTFKSLTYLSFENVVKPEYIKCEIPYDVDVLVNGLLQENRSLQDANLLMANELEETKGQLEENNNEQIATQLDLDMRLMMLEMGDL